ncbi:MAG: LON peptidase substrate-binding domain-containing protein, partial [Bacteroidaceae bacterium]|nr:LON peptidase substrate-binding domain-containing protein [Bacteroidaceae bacterium]
MKIKFDNILGDKEDQQLSKGIISVVAEVDSSKSNILDIEISEDNEIPILPLRTMMLFPGIVLPVNIGRKSSLKLLKDAVKIDGFIGVFSQIDDNIETPDPSQIYKTGVIGKVIKILELPDGSRTALLQGFCRATLLNGYDNGDYIVGHVQKQPEQTPSSKDKEFNALVEACRDIAEKYLKMGDTSGFEFLFNLKHLPNKTILINYICANLPIDNVERITLLEANNLADRARA